MIWVFFFSSRRRHTRFKCDWSSDVCSSDLDAKRGRRPPSTLNVSAEIPLRPRVLPKYLHLGVASFSLATPACVEQPPSPHKKLDQHTCSPGKWNPSSRHRCPTGAADTLHFQCARASSS